MRNHHLHHVVDTDGADIVSSFDLLGLVEDHRYTAKNPPTPAKHERGRR